MVITENEKSKVIFSSLLERHYPKMYSELANILWSYHKGYGYLTHTKDYWVRDFMPIQMDENVLSSLYLILIIFKTRRSTLRMLTKLLKTVRLHKNTR